MYRIYLTSFDLARTRVADAPMPLMELGLAIRAMRARPAGLALPGRRSVVASGR